MKKHKTYILLLPILISLCMGCDMLNRRDIYKRPDWLPGKLYTAVSAQKNLSMFAECLRLTGLDTIVNVSGSWTIFAPTDEAMKQYLNENHYASLSDIPLDELERITEFHIIQDAWTLEQLQNLTAYGWRTEDNGNRSSYAYKFQTMLKNPVEKYWVKRENGKDMIVPDSANSDGYKRVFVQSRKYAPIFYDKYMAVNGLSSEDYSFYFDRPYEPGNVYYGGAKILQSDIFAENGFIHIIDRVVDPMLNAQELLDRNLPGESYKLFLEMVNWYYPSFVPDMTATNNQPEVRRGGLVDTLWDLSYSPLTFDLNKELIKQSGYGNNFTYSINSTLVNHNGLFVPTDDAFSKFIDGILTVKSGFPHWRDFKSLPQDIVAIIVPPHFKSSPIYPTTYLYQQIFKGAGSFKQNDGDIIRKEFGSNCTFLGLSSYIPNRVFTSVTGPVFCRPSYSLFRLAMQYSGVDDMIADNTGVLYFFPIPDYALEIDSALILNWINIDQNRYNFKAYDKSMHQMVVLDQNTIRNLILNQVGTSTPGGSDNKEIIRTLRGNSLTWDHSDNTIQGTLPSTNGYNGGAVTTCTPVRMNEPTDNGSTWSVNYWFNFRN